MWTVSYAEAITMAIRVLGYKTVVEAKGTWPTNYIAKAEELDLLEDITYGTYAAGAARGNVALLIWNMLRTNMWSISSESEGDGLTYRDNGDTMLDTKFKDFSYDIVDFVKWTNDDGEIKVTLTDAVNEDSYSTLEDTVYTYAETDFYTFVPGSEVEVLVNEKDGTLLSMVRTDEFKYFAGSEVEIDEEYDDNNLSGDAYVYAYLRLDGKDIEDSVVIKATSEYIYELDDSSSKKLKFNGTKGDSLVYEKFEDVIVLKDGAFASIKDLEVGDVLTTVYDSEHSGVAFYMIAGAEAEGKLTKLVEEKFENTAAGTYHVATIDGTEYPVAAGAVYFVDAEKVEDSKEKDFLGTDSDTFKDMKNEEVTFVTDVFGRVTAVMFDGKLNAGDADEGSDESKFYALTAGVERDGSTYTIAVANEDGEETLTFAKNVGNAAWKADTDLTGYFVIMTLNSDDEIEALSGDYSGENNLVLRAEKNEAAAQTAVSNITTTKLFYNEDGDYYTVAADTKVTFEDNKLSGEAGLTAKVNDDTVVVTLVFDDKGTEKDTDDEYRVEFAGIEALDGMKKDPAVVITDASSSNFARAKYVVIYDEVSSREDDLVGIVKNVSVNKLGDTVVTIVEDRDDEAKDGVEYILADGQSIEEDGENGVQAIIYSIEENKDGDWELTVNAKLTNKALTLEYDRHGYIAEATSDENPNVSDDGREAKLSDGSVIDLDDEDTAELYEDARFFIVNVVLDEDETEDYYMVDNYSEVEYTDVAFEELDRLSVIADGEDVEFVIIIRGMDAAK